jgi:hypothetical protein
MTRRRKEEKLTRQGVFNIPQPSGEELITRLLDLMLKQDDPERSFVKFKEGDDLVLLVNNQGGMSALEMGAVVDETLSQLGTLNPFLSVYGLSSCSRPSPRLENISFPNPYLLLPEQGFGSAYLFSSSYSLHSYAR